MEIKTIYNLLYDWNNESSEDIYLEDDERCYTVKEVFQIVNSLMKELKDYGMGKEVLLRASRNIKTILLFYAILSSGTICYLSSPHEKAADFLKEQNLSMTVLTDEDGQFKYEGKTISFKETEALSSARDTLESFSFVMFTSGSTGRRKGVKLNEKSLLLGDMMTEPIGDYRREDVSGAILPLDHVFGLCLILESLLTRHKAYFPKNMDMPSLVKSFKIHNVSRLNGVPSLYQSLANELEKENTQLEKLRIGLLGGSPSNKKQILSLEKQLHMKLLSVYGMTECCTISAISIFDDDVKSMTTLGKPYPHVQIKFAEITDSPFKEILIKSSGMFLGYLNEENPFLEDGYFKTGDIGYMTKDGYLVLTGRKKDIIIRNGNNIVSKVIEDAFSSISKVKEAAVLASKDDKEGEVTFLFLTLKQNAAIEDILEKGNADLKKNERIFLYKILEEMPHTASGKIDKCKLKELL